MQKSGRCPKCESLEVIRYTSRYGTDSNKIRYLCTECGLLESHVEDVKTLMEDPVVTWEWMRPKHDGPFR